jgi:hypothetical protein
MRNLHHGRQTSESFDRPSAGILDNQSADLPSGAPRPYSFFWFLREGSNRAAVLGQYLRIGVEERSLDVAGFFVGNVLGERFRPNVTVAIIETKRPEEELADHVEQPKTHMLREQCRAGLLLNGRQATWLSFDGEFAQPHWTAQPLTDLCEAEERIEQACINANTYLADRRHAFTAAGAGDFDSLVSLVSLFGWNLGLTFALSIRAKGALGAVQAFSSKKLGCQGTREQWHFSAHSLP